MKNYLNLLEKILLQGEEKGEARDNMTSTYSLFGERLEFDLQEGFPLITTKDVSFENIVNELLWFLKGRVDLNYLIERKCNIWNEDAFRLYKKKYPNDDTNLKDFIKAVKDGYTFNLTNQYGWLWRDKELGDQIRTLITSLRDNPNSRRHIVSNWNIPTLDKMALPACHTLFQCYVRRGEFLDLKLTMRSSDVFLGLPYNIGSYALLNHILAHYSDLRIGRLILDLGDVHIYTNLVEQVKLQLTRKPLPLSMVSINFRDTKDPSELELPDFSLKNYFCHEKISGKVSTGLVKY